MAPKKLKQPKINVDECISIDPDTSSRRVLQLNEKVLILAILRLLLLVAEYFVLEAVLEQNLVLARVRRNEVVQLEQAGLGVEEDFEDDGYQIRSNLSSRKLEGLLELSARTCVANQCHFSVHRIVLRFNKIHAHSSEQVILLSSVAHSILVGTVNDVAEGGCECAVELYFTLVFIATRLIQIIVNEALHGVDVDDMARDHVSRVREDLGCQGQVQVLAEIVHFEKQLPVYRVRFLEVVELRFVVPIVIYLL